MSQTVEELRSRAAQARRDADNEALDNARQKHLNAAASWDALARRAEALREQRVAHAAATAAAAAVSASAAEG